jgi:hypothetical protein
VRGGEFSLRRVSRGPLGRTINNSENQMRVKSKYLSFAISLGLLLHLISCSPSSRTTKIRPSPDEVKTSDVAFKSLDDYTTQDELWFSIRVTVKSNLSSTKRIVVELQGVDKDGFEIEEFHLESDFAPGELKILSDKTFLKTKLIQSIVRWQVGSIYYSE